MTDQIPPPIEEGDPPIEQEYHISVFTIIRSTYDIVFSAFFIIISVWLMISIPYHIVKPFFIPFILCGIAWLAVSILRFISIWLLKDKKLTIYKKYQKWISNSKKLYLISFSIFWYGFLVIADIYMIYIGNITMIVFSLIFWIVGTLIIVSNWKKSSK